MIYQINTQQLPLALSNGGEIIIMSSNSSVALVRSTNIADLIIINEYEDDMLSELMLLDFWRQPCTNC